MTLMNIIQKCVFRTFQYIIIKAVRVEFRKISCPKFVNKIIFELSCLFYNEVIKKNRNVCQKTVVCTYIRTE